MPSMPSSGTPRVAVKVLERRPAQFRVRAPGPVRARRDHQEPRADHRVDAHREKENVVKFRTAFARCCTRVCHHLDYELYKLDETFHTETSTRAESALVRELLGESPTASGPAASDS